MKKYYYAILLLSIFTCYSQDNEIYSMAETRPQPNEDIVKVGKKIAQNIPCLKTGINYYFNFIVEKDGSFSNVNLVRGELDTTIENCNESIQTAFANSPKWIPGKNGNIPVRIQFMLIIKKESDNNVEEDVKNDISNLNGNNNIGESETVNEIGSFYFSYARKRKSDYQEKLDNSNLDNSIDENSYWKKNECGLWMIMIGDIYKEDGGYKTFDEWYKDYNKNVNKQLIGKSILNKPDGEWSYNDGLYEVKGNFIQGKPNGKWEYRYYEKHILKSEKIENYKNGVPDGEWFVLVDGIKDIYSVENFVLGKREGLCYLNYVKKDKEIMEIHFKNGIPNGKYSIYYMDWKTGKKKISMSGIHENGYITEMEEIYQPEYEKNEGEYGQNMKSGKVLVSRKIEIFNNLNKFNISEKYADVYNKERKLKPNQKLIPNEELNVIYEYDRADGCDIKDEIYFFPDLTGCDRYKQYGGNWIAK